MKFVRNSISGLQQFYLKGDLRIQVESVITDNISSDHNGVSHCGRLVTCSPKSNLPSCVVVADRSASSVEKVRGASSVGVPLHEGLVKHSATCFASSSHSLWMSVDEISPCLSLVLPNLLNVGLYVASVIRKDKVLTDVFGTHAIADIKPFVC
jgi:hypothetical protein